MNRPHYFLVFWIGLALPTLLGLAACKKAAKTGETGDSSGGTASGNKNTTGSGSNPPARPTLPAGWREFKHPEGVYSVFVPALPQRDPKTQSSLRLKQPLGPNESRESIHIIQSTASQPFVCHLEVMLFDPSLQSILEQSYEQNRPKDHINRKFLAYRPVTWAGRRATEAVIEKTFSMGPNAQQLRFYQVSRFMFAPGRLYNFAIERGDRMPNATELAAFFDSFAEGN